MKPATGWLSVAASIFLIFALSGVGHAAVADHLDWGQIIQGRIYDDPNIAAPFYFFLLELETDATVAYIEFVTPAGYVDVIPPDEYTSYGDVDTYHWVYGSTHVWEYWGYFTDAGPLDDYGDGLYLITVFYTNGAQAQTTVYYGIPGPRLPIPMPAQRPNLTWPLYDGADLSPVTFFWDPVTDLSVSDIYLGVVDESGAYVVQDIYDIDSTYSDPYGLAEGWYDVEFKFENYYGIVNPDGVPFDLLKTSVLLQSFEVVFSTVYRFWSPVTHKHFYTLSEREKNKLIDTYSHVWTFEGPAFYAWATRYDANLSPVYRFWSGKSRSHFYTISEREKDKLIRDYPHVWTYEGVAFYAFEEGRQPSGAKPIYRFYRPSDGTHFYTISAQEADKLLRDYSHIYVFERIAYYAYD